MNAGVFESSAVQGMRDEQGDYKQPSFQFKSESLEKEPGRYHLYLCYSTVECHRVLLHLLQNNLEDAVDYSILHPSCAEESGWSFRNDMDGCTGDLVNDKQFLHEIYCLSHPSYSGQVSLPLLWDKESCKIISNEVGNICKLLDQLRKETLDGECQSQVDSLNSFIHQHVLLNLYKAGLTLNQRSYEEACKELFESLEQLDSKLQLQPFLVTDSITSADLYAFSIMIRFDAAFYGVFKCNIKRLVDFPNLFAFTVSLFNHQRISETVKLEHIKHYYYTTFPFINGKTIVPKGGVVDFGNIEVIEYYNKYRQNCLQLQSEPTMKMEPSQHSHDVSPKPNQKGESEEEKEETKGKEKEVAGESTATVAGEFIRPRSAFRDSITADGRSEFQAEKGRYHLYIANNCPWCHRVVLTRKIKQLEDIISMDVCYYRRHPDKGWTFNPDIPGCTEETVNGIQFIRELYEALGSKEKSVPILWDKKLKTIVNNESSEIIRILNSAFDELVLKTVDLYPPHLRQQIDELNSWIYPEINNGAYKAGFASTQEAYDKAYDIFFNALDKLEKIFAQHKFLCGDEITEADVRLFPTIFRFDDVYYIRFLLNKKMIREYPNIYRWEKDMYLYPGVADASNIVHCKNGYFGRSGNEIVPLGQLIGL